MLHAADRATSGMVRWGGHKLWPTLAKPSLASTNFGQNQLWPNQVWPAPTLSKPSLARHQIWPAPSFRFCFQGRGLKLSGRSFFLGERGLFGTGDGPGRLGWNSTIREANLRLTTSQHPASSQGSFRRLEFPGQAPPLLETTNFGQHAEQLWPVLFWPILFW